MIVKGSFEDILFIALGLIWVIYSAIKGNKKRSAGKNHEESPEYNDSGDLFDELLSELTGKERRKEKEIVKSVVADEIIDREEKSIDWQNYSSFDDEYEKRKVADNWSVDTGFKEDEIKVNEVKDSINEEKRVSFNLKKAFIYSEILKQKYM
jgi:hypothetical protein